jgi:hypothetical protein
MLVLQYIFDAIAIQLVPFPKLIQVEFGRFGLWDRCAQFTRRVDAVHGGFILKHEKSGSAGVGARSGEVAMKASLLFLLTVTVLIVGTLAVMNNACKSGQHAWCAPMSTLRYHIKAEHS